MNKRIQKLRKDLNLTQQEFADKISVKRGTIANYEIGRNVPSDSVVTLICREFNVTEEWLRNGTGAMYNPAPTTSLDALAKEYNLDYDSYVAIEKFLKLSAALRRGMIAYFKEVTCTISNPPLENIGCTSDDEAEYRKKFGFAPQEGSTASNTTNDTAVEKSG